MTGVHLFHDSKVYIYLHTEDDKKHLQCSAGHHGTLPLRSLSRQRLQVKLLFLHEG